MRFDGKLWQGSEVSLLIDPPASWMGPRRPGSLQQLLCFRTPFKSLGFLLHVI
ncbi:hypothetical protein C8R48DRAFT_696219 [Suillus tomentosus]|nr:hypothetical protein C8R48DRAFT_696219 [Suillus tomentosus]